MPFGLPERRPDVSPLIDALSDSAGNIQVVVSALVEELGKSLTTSEQLNDSVLSTARRSLQKRIGLSSTQIEQLIAQLAAQLESSMAVNASELGATTAAIADSEGVDQPSISVGTTLENPPQFPLDSPDGGPKRPQPMPENPWTVEREQVNESAVDSEKVEIVSASISGDTLNRIALDHYGVEAESFLAKAIRRREEAGMLFDSGVLEFLDFDTGE